ncbi:uracil-DNA glycosylase family protein [Solimicrobium silvestre]|uniref:Uracil DNA glycosylase superfamily n=1 Tax=Solimicrobium silvestre TaxID=2099400 RepID=A0A2S9GUW4_9BURK|nr:uracil-DNA glycosylase family protein [Solimicrobium silvestre]PRC91509.1 Uracil DNA glycosylase superfamily [Solimicrobium silvestre]
MLLSRLNEMSVGPLWVLRNQPVAQLETQAEFQSEIQSKTQSQIQTDACPVCGQAWLQSTLEGSSIVVVLAAPITDAAQQKLLDNCLQAAGWHAESSCFTLHVSCTSSPDASLMALQAQIAAQTPELIVVFGSTAATMINAEFSSGQIAQYANTRLIVTHHPAEMIANPSLKAQVWADLCLAKFGIVG